MNRRHMLVLAASSVATSLAAPQAARSAAPLARARAPGYLRMHLAGLEIPALVDGTVALPLDQLYRNTTPERVNRDLAAAFLNSPTELSVNAYLVNTGDRLVLVDAGTGTYLGDSLGHLEAALAAAGYRADQVDAVVLTHVHTDHSGGLVSGGRPVFPNATVHVNQREVAYWLSDKEREKAPEAGRRWFREAAEALGPYAAAGRLHAFADNADPVPGFGSIWLPGHTPGHSAIVLRRDGRKLVIWGDVTHGDVLQFGDPTITIEFDVDPEQAAGSRAKAFGDAAAGRHWVAGAHVAFPGVGHVRAAGAGFDWVPMNFSTQGQL